MCSPAGYLHLLRAVKRWSSSFSKICLVVHTVFALCLRVLMTLYFAVLPGLFSHTTDRWINQYRKPTHTDMYLHWDSYHQLAAKYSVINTLRHRAKTVCTTNQILEKEEDHLFTALRRCKYPAGAWTRTNIQRKQKNKQGTSNTMKSHIVVPYMKGLSETCKNICRRHGVEVYFKGGRTIRDLLVHPKDKDTILKKSGVIYKYSCGRVDCGEEYIGESGRTFGERYREHMRSPSPIMDCHNTTGHEVSLDNFTIVGREDNNIARNIKETIFVRVNDPSLNRNIGKFQLSHIWDEVLARSPELHLK